MKHIYDKSFAYLPAKDQTVEMLREKFDRIRAEIEANRKEAEAKVKPMVKLKRTA